MSDHIRAKIKSFPRTEYLPVGAGDVVQTTDVYIQTEDGRTLLARPVKVRRYHYVIENTSTGNILWADQPYDFETVLRQAAADVDVARRMLRLGLTRELLEARRG